MMPLWRASEMDHQMHQTIRTQSFGGDTLNNVLERAHSEPRLLNEKHIGSDVTDSEVGWLNSMRGRSGKKFDPEKALAIIPSEHPLRPARNPPKPSVYDYLPFLRILRPVWRPITKRLGRKDDPEGQRRSFTGKKIRPEVADSNVPTEITLFLSTYFAMLLKAGQLQPASATTMVNAISALQDTVTNLERIKNTPLPFAYQAHLRISLWYVHASLISTAITDSSRRLYLFFLPVCLSFLR